MAGGEANSSGQIAWFIILSLIYAYMDYAAQTAPTPDNKVRGTYFTVYLLLSVIGQYFITLGESKSLCGTSQFYTSTFAVFFPWTFIFGVMVLTLRLFPAWLAPFSNTFGYLVASMSGLSPVVRKIFKQKIESDDDQTAAASKALSHIYADQSALINQITPSNFDEFWKRVAGLRTDESNTNDVLKNKLRHLVILKDTIAHLMWYGLTGALVISVSYNYLVNTNCSMTVAQVERDKTESADTQAAAALQVAAEPIYTADE